MSAVRMESDLTCRPIGVSRRCTFNHMRETAMTLKPFILIRLLALSIDSIA